DMVFLDAAPDEAGDYADQAIRMLRPGGILAVAEALWHDRVADPARRDETTVAMREVGRTLREREDISANLLPVGGGHLGAITSGGMPEVPAWAIAVFVARLLIIAFATVSISANRNPSSAIAWVLVIACVPALGIVAYLLIGTAKLPAERRRKQQYVTDHLLTRDDGTMTRAGRSNTWP